MKMVCCCLVVLMLVCTFTAFASDGCVHEYEMFVKEPDCVNDGYTLNTCLLCGYEYTDEPVPATGHQIVYSEMIPPSCEKPGFTVSSHCFVCGDIFEDVTDIPALGHDWEITDIIPYTLAGYTCQRCKDDIDRSSQEYVRLETDRLLQSRIYDLRMEDAVMELYYSYKDLPFWDKDKIIYSEELILSARGFMLFRMGDIDQSGEVDLKDLSLLIDGYGHENEKCDVNSDGIVNGDDLSILLSCYGLDMHYFEEQISGTDG